MSVNLGSIFFRTPDDEVPQRLGACALAPQRSELGEGADFFLRVFERLPDRRQVFGADAIVGGELRERPAGSAILETSRRAEVGGVVGGLLPIEVDDLVDAVLVAVG